MKALLVIAYVTMVSPTLVDHIIRLTSRQYKMVIPLELINFTQLIDPKIPRILRQTQFVAWPSVARSFLHGYRFIVIQFYGNLSSILEVAKCNNYCLYIIVASDPAEISLVNSLPAIQRLRFRFVLISNNREVLPGSLKDAYFDLKKFELRNGHFNLGASSVVPFSIPGATGPSGRLGVTVEAVRTTSKLYNFTYKLRIYRSKYFMYPNGSWGGNIGDVESGRMDFIFSAVGGGSVDRYRAVEYATFGFGFDLIFITGQPLVFLDWSAFVQPFDGPVWLWLAVLCIVILLANWLQYLNRKIPQAFSAAFITMLAPLLSQSVHIIKSLRTLTIIWLIGGLVLGAYYGSNLRSYITHPSLESVPKDFYELSQHEDYEINMIQIAGSVFNIFMKLSTVASVVKIRERYHLTRNFSECVIRAGTLRKTVCIGPTIVLQPLIHGRLKLHKQFEPVVYSQRAVLHTFMHSILQKDSKYTEAVNFITGWSRDTGLVTKWSQNVLEYFQSQCRLWLRKDEGMEVKEKLLQVARNLAATHEQAFEMKHLYVPFGILGVGMLVAVLGFLWERISKHTRSAQRDLANENVVDDENGGMELTVSSTERPTVSRDDLEVGHKSQKPKRRYSAL